MIYKFGERLTEISQEEWEKEKCPAVFLTDSNHAEETLSLIHIYRRTCHTDTSDYTVQLQQQPVSYADCLV